MVMGIALVAITLWAAGSFSEQAAPDAKDEGMITPTGTGLSVDTDDESDDPDGISWKTVDGLSGTLHKAQRKDLVIDVSLECGIYTETEVKSKGGNKEESNAEGSVMVRVKYTNIDSGDTGFMTTSEDVGILFCQRSETLSAELQGLIDGCIDEDGHIINTLECLDDETISLILATMNANSFNFIKEDLPQVDYRVEVEAQLAVRGSAGNGSYAAKALIGWGSTILSEVRLVKRAVEYPDKNIPVTERPRWSNPRGLCYSWTVPTLRLVTQPEPQVVLCPVYSGTGWTS